MIRLLIVAAILSFTFRMIAGRWPWYYLGEQPTRQQAVFRARKLLGVSVDASHAQIIEAHRRHIAIVHPDRGGTSEQVHEANAARDLLLAELPDRAN